MSISNRLEEATEAAYRLRIHTATVGIRSEKEMEYFTKDLATVIVFLDTVLPNFFQELTMLADEVKK
jgi:hypothetical protein